jgi:hypothetical protein
MPYLHWERSIARHHIASIVEDAQETVRHLNRTSFTAKEISRLPCGPKEKMIRFQVALNAWLHLRRTLDQAYYSILKSTEARDRDQVVERYSRRTWPEEGDHRVLMVDNLWMWVLYGSA